MQKAEPVFDVITEHGEGPVWDPIEGNLYWVDLLEGDYIKTNLGTGETKRFNLGQPLGVLALRAKGGLVVALRDGFAFWDEATRQLDFIHTPEKENTETRFNDGAVDPDGRFFAGTMTMDGKKDIGNLYRLGTDKSLKKVESSLFIPNGMAWSMDAKTFYLTDTHRNVIFAYDYELESGDITNRRTFIQFEKHEFPDGLTTDTHGNFWIAMFGGSKICQYDRLGKKANEITLPVQYPTSCCFGGDKLSTLFVTTSKLVLSEAERKQQPLAGSMFRLETDVVGVCEPRFKG
jgi:xylono-1,5-lactonase